MKTISITRPDDFHLHLRDGATLPDALLHSVARFARAIVMPNLDPPVRTVSAAADYRQRILAALPHGARFDPLMTLYLTDDTSADEIRRAGESPIIHGIKLYPAGATTNSASGVTDLTRTREILEELQAQELPLLVHAEVTDANVDVFTREAVFVERHLQPILHDFPRLRVVLEHVSSAAGVECVQADRSGRLAASVTVQHLALNRNALFEGGLRPHRYCLPVLKRESDRQAILQAVCAGDSRFFAGTDSAPHERASKERDRGCAGVFSSPCALEAYASILDAVGALDRLENFCARFGADFYGLPHCAERMRLVHRPYAVPATLPYGSGSIVPYAAGEVLPWSLVAPDTGA